MNLYVGYGTAWNAAPYEPQLVELDLRIMQSETSSRKKRIMRIAKRKRRETARPRGVLCCQIM